VCLSCMSVGVSAAPAEGGTLELSAPSAILIEQTTGNVLFEKNPDERRPLASVTKIMTMLLTMEAIDGGKITLEDKVVASERAKSMGGSTIFLDTGEEMSVNDLLKGIAVASGNDACVAMAEYIAGSEEGFVNMMNARAAELGMTNTNFVNTNGLDADNHYSSARDIAIMSRELLKHKKIFDYTTIWMDSLRDGKFQLANTNKLIRFYKGANGLKTGSTDKALCCLSGSAMRDNLQLICVVMAAPTSPQRFADASKMLDYGFANYAIKRIVTKDESLGDAPVVNGMEQTVPAVAKDDYDALTAKGDNTDIKRELVFNDTITAPIKIGDKIGEIQLSTAEGPLAAVDIVAAGNVAKMTYGAMLGRTLMAWLGSVK
jgi:D-alanyl-D-alanine carboxypeptidase (penicillin-binding protein 5/6)